jgi:ketosteroid isomerase-like protein
MKRLPFLLFVLAAACAPPPAPPPPVPPAPDPAEVRRAIEDANAKATAAMVKGDLSAVFDAAYANDAVLLMSNLPKGDLAVETGAYEMTLVPKKGPEVTDTGKYLTVWRKQPDGSWKVIRDAGNTNGPPSK